MRVDCISDRELTPAEMGAVLTSCWPDFAVAPEDIKTHGKKGVGWQVPVPAPLAERIRANEQPRWQNSATVRVGDGLAPVVLTFDPASADES